MAGVIASIPKFQFSNALGLPMSGGTLTSYLAGTTTPVTTYQDEALTSANTNPISLDSRGECTLWLDSTKVYKFVLKNAAGVTQWTVDNITNSTAFAQVVKDELDVYKAAVAASSGSSLVGFLQPGTGAVATTVQGKLRESVSAVDFGADPTGATDSTAAITASLIASDVVILPAGTYKVSQIVITGSGNSAALGKTLLGDGLGAVNIIGSIAGTSVIRFGTTGGWVDEPNLQEYRADYCNLENITVSATAAYTYGIECQWLTNSSWKNVNVSSGGFIGTGIYLNYSWDNDFTHTTIAASLGIVCGAQSPNRNTFHGLRLAGGGAGGGTKYGLDIAGSGNSFFGFDISGYDYGVVSSLGGFGVILNGGYFESNTYDVTFGGSSISGISITGCVFLNGAGVNCGIRQTGGGNVRGMVVTGNAFRSKTDAVILTTSVGKSNISFNDYLSCTRTITAAGLTNFIEDDDGALQPLSGQIKFPSVQNPSTNPNTLDDYEEGTFTPTASGMTVVLGAGAVTYSGQYIKIGKLVSYSIFVDASGGATTASTAGVTYFTGLPFNESGSATGTLQAVDGGIVSLGSGTVSHSGITRAYAPTWSARASDIYIAGMYMAAA